MRNRIDTLLFNDSSRLPLLALVPQGRSVTELTRLRPALVARKERIEELIQESDVRSSVVVQESYVSERSERDMLQVALDWIALQEEK